MSSETALSLETINMHLGSKLYISDLLRIQWNYPLRWEVLVQYLEYCLLRSSYKPNTEILYSIPVNNFTSVKAIVLLSLSSFIFGTTHSLYFINCSEELQNISKKVIKRDQNISLRISLENDPYLIVDICSIFEIYDLTASPDALESLIFSSNSNRGKSLLQSFIFKNSDLPTEKIEEKLKEVQSLSNIPVSSSNPCSSPSKATNLSQSSDSSDLESTYEESYNLMHHFHRAWENSGKELYKVTEYNESLECSVSEESSDLAFRLNEFSSKLTGSVADKFPKISVASLSISDGSFQNNYEQYKKSYFENVEPSDVVYRTSFEGTEGGSIRPLRHSPFDCGASALTGSRIDTFKNVLETKSELCACSKCLIF